MLEQISLPTGAKKLFKLLLDFVYLAIFRGLIVGPAPPEGVPSLTWESKIFTGLNPQVEALRASTRGFSTPRKFCCPTIAPSPLRWGSAGPTIKLPRKKTRSHIKEYIKKVKNIFAFNVWEVIHASTIKMNNFLDLDRKINETDRKIKDLDRKKLDRKIKDPYRKINILDR